MFSKIAQTFDILQQLDASKPLSRLGRKKDSFLRLLKGDPRFLVMSWLARFVALREWVSHCGRYTPPQATQSAVIQATATTGSLESAANVATTIQTDGYYEGFYLRDDVGSELIQFAQTAPCYANRNPQLPFYIHDKAEMENRLDVPLLVAGYLNDHESCRAYQNIKHDPYLLDVASQYLHHPAVYMRGELAWGFPTANTLEDKVKTARVYHCDINDYKTIKFFFYLTDVGPGEGPHGYLKGTHRTRRFQHQWIGQSCAAIPDERLVAIYGQGRERVVTGKAGFGFAGDPYCLHRGTVPTGNDRLLLQLEYGIHAYRIWYFG